MKRFFCACGQELFFENGLCLACDTTVGFDPLTLDLISGETSSGPALEMCSNRRRHGVCNWWLSPGDERADGLCRACRLTVLIPNLEQPGNVERWRKLEQSKRRLLYSLLDLNLEFEPPGPHLSFAFLEDQRTNPEVAEELILTGHANGRVTILAAEADDLFRESQRTSMNQRHRTLLGHMRHESGHFFWEQLVRDGGPLDEFRQLFGDERSDYNASLERFYSLPPLESPDFVSPYAQAHPLEDWAECWSHMLHVFDTVDTAVARQLLPTSVLAAANKKGAKTRQPRIDNVLLDRFAELAVSLNELSRGLGLNDAYPFVLTEKVRTKLRFIGTVVSTAALAK